MDISSYTDMPSANISRPAVELPSSRRLEQAVLGSLMVYPEVTGYVQDADLQAEEFFLTSHQRIFSCMLELAESGRQVDMENVLQRLMDKGDLDSVGGIEYISTLMDGAISSANIRGYIDTIQNKAQQRRLMQAAEAIIREAGSSSESIDNILDDAEQAILDITRRRRGSDFESSAMIVARVIEELKRLRAHEGVTGIKTGYLDLDDMTNGFQRGDLIILAARPAMGKSAFALNVASQVALRNEGSVAVFSLEMPSDSLIKRLMSCESQVKSDKLRSGQFNTDELSALYEAGNRLSERMIFIDDTSSIRVSQIFSKCRKLVSEHGPLSLVVIDYLQLISGSRNSDSRQQEVSEISRNLKILAKEMECPVIALSQLSRKVEERTDHQPQLSDLRESGSIEQDADIVMFLYREDYYKANSRDPEDEPSDVEVVDLSLAKHRNGAIGKVKLVFEKNISRFSNYTREPY